MVRIWSLMYANAISLTPDNAYLYLFLYVLILSSSYIRLLYLYIFHTCSWWIFIWMIICSVCLFHGCILSTCYRAHIALAIAQYIWPTKHPNYCKKISINNYCLWLLNQLRYVVPYNLYEWVSDIDVSLPNKWFLYVFQLIYIYAMCIRIGECACSLYLYLCMYVCLCHNEWVIRKGLFAIGRAVRVCWTKTLYAV